MSFQVLLLTDDKDAKTPEEAVRNLVEAVRQGLEFNFDVRPIGASLEVEPVVISNVDAFRDAE